MAFNPFDSGQATEVMDKPAPAATPAPDFNPFESGQGTATVTAPGPAAPTESQPPAEAANEWKTWYGGIDNLDEHLSSADRAVFAQLDRVSKDPKEGRAQVINRTYLGQQMPDMNPRAMSNNWDAVKTAYAKHEFGYVGKDITDTALYGLIAGRINPDERTPEQKFGSIEPWTWKDAATNDLYAIKKNIGAFWESIAGTPFVQLKDAPKDLPNKPAMGIYNPALIGGVYNALKPIVLGAETPFGVATAGIGSGLAEAAKTYPLAKAALATMTGVFTGLMGWQTAKQLPGNVKILKDPNASLEDKITAVASTAANSGATLLGAVGTAFELMPAAKVPPLLEELKGKNPAQGAKILRREAAETDVPGHSDFLNTAADELDKIAKTTDKEAAKQATPPKIEAKEAEPAPETPAEPEKPVKAEELPVEVTPEGAVSVKNDAMDEELEKMGLPKATSDEKTTFAKELQAGVDKLKADENAGTRLVDELADKSRAVNPDEVGLLTAELVKRTNARDAAQVALEKAQASGDAAAVGRAEQEVAKTRDDYEKAAAVDKKVGTKTAQGLALRRMMANRDYSLAEVERRYKAANKGKPLSPEQAKSVADLTSQLKEAQAKLDAYEKQKREAAAAPLREAPKRGKPPSKVTKFISDQAAQARQRIKERMASGRVQSGLDPQDLADHAIVGAEYIAKGVTKFADWSAAMVNELGDRIKPYLQDIFKQSVDARDQASRLQAYKTRTEGAIEKGKAKLEAGDFSKEERKKLELDPEAKKLQTEAARIRRKIQLGQMEIEFQNKSLPQKIRSFAQSWIRFGVLSYPTVLLKLGAATAARVVSTPLEQAAGAAWQQILPKALTEKARFEAIPSIGGAVRAEAKAFTGMVTEGLKGSAQLLANKNTDLTTLLEKEQLPPELIDYLGKVHAALKNPTLVADYNRRLQLLTEWNMRHDVDMANPVNQLRAMHEAYEYAHRSIFMQDNGLVNAYKSAIRTLEGKQRETGKPSGFYQSLSSGIQASLPIVKVPSNYAAEMADFVFGLPVGGAKVLGKLMSEKGFSDMTYGEADQIMRQLKKGSIGAAAVAYGYYNYKKFGGYYVKGEKRKKSDVGVEGVKVGDTELPKQASDSPVMSAAQYGATIARVGEALTKKAGGKFDPFMQGVFGASVGALDHVPFVEQMTQMSKLGTWQGFLDAADAKAASIMIPGIVQWIASQGDKKDPFSLTESATPRKSTDLEGAIKKDIPGLRETLPKRNIHRSYR